MTRRNPAVTGSQQFRCALFAVTFSRDGIASPRYGVDGLFVVKVRQNFFAEQAGLLQPVVAP